MTDIVTRRRPKLQLKLPANDRYSGEIYRAAYSGIFDATVSKGFHALIEKIDLGGAILARSNVAGQQTFRRTAAHIRRTESDNLQLISYESGSWRGDYDGRSSTGSLGGIRLMDASLPMVHASTPNQFIALSMSRKTLGLEGHGIHGLSLNAELAGVRLLTAHLRTLWDIAPELTPLEASAAIAASAALLKGVIGNAASAYVVDREPIERTLLAMARDYMDKHLGESTLSPGEIGAHLSVSPRTLYRVFEPFGGVSAYIQVRRLDKAYEALKGSARESIANIAYASGFVSTSHFGRAFRARFGVTPGDLRSGTDIACTFTPASTVLDWMSNG